MLLLSRCDENLAIGDTIRAIISFLCVRCKKKTPSGICSALWSPACHPETVKKKHPTKHRNAQGTCPGRVFSELAATGLTGASVEAEGLLSLIYVEILSVYKVIFLCYSNETWKHLLRFFLLKICLVFSGRTVIRRSLRSLASKSLQIRIQFCLVNSL